MASLLISWGVLLAAACSRPSTADPHHHQVCSGRFSTPEFQLVSPGYPGPLSPGLACDYVVEAVSGSICRLELTVAALQSPVCPAAHLVVAGHPICGEQRGIVTVPFHPPSSTITFRGDPGGGAGFNMTVRQGECSSPMHESCGGEYSEETVVMTSPGYPSRYPAGAACSYTIRPISQDICQLQVTFDDSELEKSANCSKDSLQIDGDRLCGRLLGVRNYDFSGDLQISFTTDADVSGKGFNLTARQIRCNNLSPVPNYDHFQAKQDFVDCEPQLLPENPNPTFRQEGYFYQIPLAPFPLPGRSQWNLPSRGYLPTYNRPPVERFPAPIPQYPTNLAKIPKNIDANYYTRLQIANVPPPDGSIPSVVYRTQPPRNSVDNRLKDYPKHFQYRPNSVPFTQYQLPGPLGSYQPFQNSAFDQYQQCCGQIYTDSNFLLVTPGFPKSQSSDCIYVINRFSPLTYQIRLQFRYFWVGQDTGTGCTGGYLEIDGTKVCGCKTGIIWNAQFFDSEPSKILHLRLDTYNGKAFNGFVIEVYQDDSYSQRYRRLEDSGSSAGGMKLSGGRISNVSQYVETVVERDSGQGVDRSAAQLTWDPARQAWTPPTELLCLRWSLQDLLLLVKEALWARYQCPRSAPAPAVVDAARYDVTQTTACRTCYYFCRQNCQCC